MAIAPEEMGVSAPNPQIRVDARDPAWQAEVRDWLVARGHPPCGPEVDAPDIVISDHPTNLQAPICIVGRAAARRFCARLEQLLRTRPSTRIALAGGVLDLQTGLFRRAGSQTRLTPTERRLAHVLIDAGGRTVTRAELLERVWRTSDSSRVLDATMARLRAKIEIDARRPTAIITAYGVGYRLCLDRAAPPAPSNLPPPDVLVGRTAELARAMAELRETRQVWLTGRAGLGKTHLALAIGERARAWIPGGAWYCDLRTVESLQGARARVSAVLGVRNSARLDDALKARRSTLLILDHVDAVAGLQHQVDRWREQVPLLHLLVISRAASAGTPVRLGPLPVDEAVHLFIQRAGPDFVVDAQGQALIERIVQGLLCVPMSICLAAGRTAVLDLAEYASNLDAALERFGSPDARTEAAIELAWTKLPPAVRTLVKRCAVLPGSFGADAAEVAMGEPVLDALNLLVEQAFVGRRRIDGQVRLQMHAAVRQSALARATVDVEPLIRHFITRAQRLADAPLGIERAQVLRRLQLDRPNLEWVAARSPHPAVVYAIAAIISREGPLDSAVPELLEVAENPKIDLAWRARAIHLAAGMAWAVDDRRLTRRVVASARAFAAVATGQARAIAYASAAVLAGSFGDARQTMALACADFDASLGEAEAAHVMARVGFAQGHILFAKQALQRAVLAFDQPATRARSAGLGSSGVLLATIKDWPGARDEAHALATIVEGSDLRDRAMQSEFLLYQGCFALDTERVQVGRDLLLASLSHQKASGYRVLRPITLTFLGWAQWALDDLSAARATLAAALVTPTHAALRAVQHAMASAIEDALGHDDASARHAAQIDVATLDAVARQACPLYLGCRRSVPLSEAARLLAQAEMVHHPELMVTCARRMLARRIEQSPQRTSRA